MICVFEWCGPRVMQVQASLRKSLDAPSWPGVYRLSISLMERLLKTLRYNFLTEALDFVGVHQERILQVCWESVFVIKLNSSICVLIVSLTNDWCFFSIQVYFYQA